MNEDFDPVDAIMLVMHEAFDPAFGEAWTRRQISDALVLPNTYYRLAVERSEAGQKREIQGFSLSRHSGCEEELLLIGVRPRFRKSGIGARLLRNFCTDAQSRGARDLFLEMRDGNCAEILYRSVGFTCVGRRKDYYRNAAYGPFDALTFKLAL